MIFRNIFGNLEYRIGDFFVENHKDRKCPFIIHKEEAWYITDAIMKDFLGIGQFDSFIQAAIWLKNNHAELI